MKRTYRGIVCEKKTKYMVFLTEKGEFLRGVPIGDTPEIGEEADFTLVASSLIAGRKAKPRFVAAVLVAAALLFFIVSSLSPLNDKVMAYVQLEASTAMEFGVNRKGNVISLRYLNETPNDPERLLEWKDDPILTVLNMAVLELSVHDKQIIITTIYPTRESEPETRQFIGNAVQEVREKHDELNLKIEESSPEERKVANKKKMSIHQFKSTHNEKSSKKQPVNDKNPIEEKSVQEQTDALHKTKKETVPPAHSQQKGIKEKERSNTSEEHQGPPAEKKEKKQNIHRSENVPPHTDKKEPPKNPPGLEKKNNSNQGQPAKQQKEHRPHENKQNP